MAASNPSKSQSPTASSSTFFKKTSASPFKRLGHIPWSDQASIGAGLPHFRPFTGPLRPAQDSAAYLKSPPNAANRSSAFDSNEAATSGRFGRIEGMSSGENQLSFPKVKESDIVGVGGQESNLGNSSSANHSPVSNKRRHDQAVGDLLAHNERADDGGTVSLKEVPRTLEQQKVIPSSKRHKIDVSGRTGVDALKGSSSDWDGQRSSRVNSDHTDDNEGVQLENQGGSSPVPSSFGSDRQGQVQVHGDLSSSNKNKNNNSPVVAIPRSPSATFRLSPDAAKAGKEGEHLPKDWYSTALKHSGLIMEQLQVGSQKKQSFELKLAKIAGELKQLSVTDVDNQRKLSSLEKNFKVVASLSRNLNESSLKFEKIADNRTKTAVAQSELFEKTLPNLKKARNQVHEIGKEKYDLDPVITSLRDRYSQISHQMESDIQAAVDMSVSQREAADQARFDLAEAKDKIKELESRIISQQESLEDKSSRLIVALSSEAKSHQDLKRIRSEISAAILRAQDLESDLEKKENELSAVKQHQDELITKNSSLSSNSNEQKAELASLGNQKSELQIQLSHSEEKVTKLCQDAATASETHLSALASVGVLQKEKDLNQAQVNQLLASMQDLKQQVSASQIEIVEIETKLDETQKKLVAVESLFESMNKEVESFQADKYRADGLVLDLSKEKDQFHSLQASSELIQHNLKKVRQELEREGEVGRVRSEENDRLIASISTLLDAQKNLTKERQDQLLSLQSQLGSFEEERFDPRSQEAEMASLREELEYEEARIKVLISKIEQSDALQVSSADKVSQLKINVQNSEKFLMDTTRELEMALSARDTFTERVAQGALLDGIELEISNTIGSSRTGPLRKEFYKLSNANKSLGTQVESERKKYEDKMANLQKENQELDAKLKALENSKKSKTQMEPNREEEENQEDSAKEEGLSVNRARSVERSGSRARSLEEQLSGKDDTDSVASVDEGEVEQFTAPTQPSRDAISSLHSGTSRGNPYGGIGFRRSDQTRQIQQAQQAQQTQAQAQAQAQAQEAQAQSPSLQTQRVKRSNTQTNTRNFGPARR